MNRLSEENSEYLKQHANNPVNWWPWCSEAFDLAKEQNKPVLVSIGYSSCHWCHVMAHESFEDPYIGELMNRYFVCIKVDREERPDVDQIYMEAVQMLGQKGGWPLNVFCFPDGRPFFGGTYFPPEDRGYNIVPWPQLLMRIAKNYENRSEDLSENADNIVKNLVYANMPMGASGSMVSDQQIVRAAEMIVGSHDDEWGGFGDAPKFPAAMTLSLLLELRVAEKRLVDDKLEARLDEVIISTLKAMAHGGIYDQLGGGFARYSVDRHWTIPHFEKMLYDNALLIGVYSKAYAQYKLPLFRSVVEETVEWLKREMGSAYPLFCASVDADSEGQEGKYYVWTQEEVKDVLGESDGKVFCDAYNISQEGNFEKGKSNPTWVYDDDKMRGILKPLREKLLGRRLKRVAPNCDGKILLSWNALLMKGLVEGGFYLGNKEWVCIAKRLGDWIWEHMRGDDGELYAVYSEDKMKVRGCLDDYVYLAQGMLALAGKVDWVEPGSSKIYVERADALVRYVLAHFRDEHEIGFYFTSDEHEHLICRKKQWLDNAQPSANSSLVSVFSELYSLSGESEYMNEVELLRKAYVGLSERAPNSIAQALEGFVLDKEGWSVLRVREGNLIDDVREKLAEKGYFNVAVMISEAPEKMEAKYQLCQGTKCNLPTNELKELKL